MNKFFQDWLTPTWVLAVFFVLLPWQTRYIFGLSYLSGASTQFGILSLYATQLLLLVGLIAIYLWRGAPRLDARYQRSLSLGAAIMLVAVVSSFFATQSIPALAALIDLAGAGIAFIALLDKRVNLKIVMSAFVLGLLIPVGLGLFQVVFGHSGASTILGLAGRDAQALGDAVVMLGNGRVLRAYGSFPHPNVFGGYLAVGVLSALSLAIGKYRRAWLIVAGALILGLVATASRSALLGLLLGGALTILVLRLKNVDLTRKLVMPIAISVVALALGLTIFAPALVAGLRGGGAIEERSLSERADQYREWPNTMSGSAWLIGNGPRSYVFTLADLHPDRGVWEYQPIHNVPLLILSELGLIGFLLVCGWVVTLDRQNFARFPNREAAYAHGLGKILFVIIFFDHYLWSSWAGLALVAAVAALMLRLGEEGSEKFDQLLS